MSLAQVMASHHDTLVLHCRFPKFLAAQMMQWHAGTKISRDVAVVESGENWLSRLDDPKMGWPQDSLQPLSVALKDKSYQRDLHDFADLLRWSGHLIPM